MDKVEENVEYLSKEKRDIIYKRINDSIKYLNFAKKYIIFLYAVDKDFLVRLYKKNTEVYDKVQDLANMIEQSKIENEPFI